MPDSLHVLKTKNGVAGAFLRGSYVHNPVVQILLDGREGAAKRFWIPGRGDKGLVSADDPVGTYFVGAHEFNRYLGQELLLAKQCRLIPLLVLSR